MKAAE